MQTVQTLGGLIRAGMEHDALAALLREADQVATHLAGNPGPGCLRRAQDAVGALSPALLAHIDTEESVVYPGVFPDEMRSAVDLLILDHERIRGGIASLRKALDAVVSGGLDERAQLTRALITLVVLVRAHQDKESFLYARAIETSDGGLDVSFG